MRRLLLEAMLSPDEKRCRGVKLHAILVDLLHTGEVA